MRRRIFFFLMAVAVAACGHAPPPPAPKPAPPPPPPPPPPKCENMTEGCTATDDTHARIRDSGWTVHPPKGWKYAQEDTATFAETGHAALVVTTETPAKDEKDVAAYRTAIGRAAVRLELHTKKGALELPKKPEKVIVVGPLKISLHQVDHAKRNDKNGALLMFWAKLPEGADLVGMGFVADDDDTKADQSILDAVSSLAPRAQAAAKDGGAS